MENGKGRHLAFSVKVWKPLFKSSPTSPPAFSETRHKWGVRSLTCRFNQCPVPFMWGCNSPSGFSFLHWNSRRTKADAADLKLEISPLSKRGWAGNSPYFNLKFTRSCWHWKMPRSRFSLNSHLYKNWTSANTKLRPDGTHWKGCSPGFPAQPHGFERTGVRIQLVWAITGCPSHCHASSCTAFPSIQRYPLNAVH